MCVCVSLRGPRKWPVFTARGICPSFFVYLWCFPAKKAICYRKHTPAPWIVRFIFRSFPAQSVPMCFLFFFFFFQMLLCVFDVSFRFMPPEQHSFYHDISSFANQITGHVVYVSFSPHRHTCCWLEFFKETLAYWGIRRLLVWKGRSILLSESGIHFLI